MKDKIIDCPYCREKAACYQIPINEFHNSYNCFGCGYTTNDLMKIGEYEIEEYESQLPELYKDMKKIDSENRVWYPQTVNILGKGTVFLNGSNINDWTWSAIKSVLLTEQDKNNPRFKGQQYKSDSTTLKNFEKDFVEACDYIGFFDL